MSNFKKLVQARMKKTGESWSTASRVIRAQVIVPVDALPVSYEGHIYAPEQIVSAARALVAKRPESHVFTTKVDSLKADGSDLVRPNGEVAEIDLVEVTFKEHRTDWYFDGAIAFIDGELWDGPTRVDASFLKTDEGKARLTKSILGSFDRWFVEQLRFFEVKRGFQNGANLVVIVTLAIKDDQEKEFITLSLALQKAHTLASNEMSKGALDIDDATGPKRAAIAAAREALERVKEAAVRDRQVDLAKRAESYERTWRRWEESLDRIEAMDRGESLAVLETKALMSSTSNPYDIGRVEGFGVREIRHTTDTTTGKVDRVVLYLLETPPNERLLDLARVAKAAWPDVEISIIGPRQANGYSPELWATDWSRRWTRMGRSLAAHYGVPEEALE